MRLLLPLCLLALAACKTDETLHAYGAAGGVWQLSELDGAAFTARATLEFPQPGRVAGQAACNRFSAAQTAPYPWFAIGPIAATKMACPDLGDENAYLAALGAMRVAEVLGDTLRLSNEAGREMVFTR